MVEVREPDILRIFIEVTSLDPTTSLVYANIIAEDGSKRKTSFLTFNSEVMKELLERFSRGEKVFQVTVYEGNILQIINKPKELLAEEDKNKPVLLTCSICPNPSSELSSSHSNYLLEQDRIKKQQREESLNRCVDSLLKYYEALKRNGKI